MRLRLQSRSIAEMKDAAVGGTEARLIQGIGLLQHQAAESAIVPIDFTDPAAFPTSFDGVFAGRRNGRPTPVAIEARTATKKAEQE